MHVEIKNNFCIQFTHGSLTLSMGVGPSHYCDNHNTDLMSHVNYTKDHGEETVGWIKKLPGPTEKAEFAIIRHGQKELCAIGHDTVAGYIPLSKLGSALQIMQIEGMSDEDKIEMLGHLFTKGLD